MSRKWINKQTVIVFIATAILFSSTPLKAAIEEFICYRADYKVLINGEEYVDENLPILNYKGNTYAPFRSVLEKAGLNVNWNAELGQAEVSNVKVNTSTSELEEQSLLINPTPSPTPYDMEREFRGALEDKVAPSIELPEGMEWELVVGSFNDFWAIRYNNDLYMDNIHSLSECKVTFDSENEIIGYKEVVIGKNVFNSPIRQMKYYIIVYNTNNRYNYEKTDTSKVIEIDKKEYYNSSWLKSLK